MLNLFITFVDIKSGIGTLNLFITFADIVVYRYVFN